MPLLLGATTALKFTSSTPGFSLSKVYVRPVPCGSTRCTCAMSHDRDTSQRARKFVPGTSHSWRIVVVWCGLTGSSLTERPQILAFIFIVFISDETLTPR